MSTNIYYTILFLYFLYILVYFIYGWTFGFRHMTFNYKRKYLIGIRMWRVPNEIVLVNVDLTIIIMNNFAVNPCRQNKHMCLR